MNRLLPKRIILATHNKGKLAEFVQLFRGHKTEIVSAGSLNLPSPEETGVTFAENALLKAKAASDATGCFALSDDSGICVTALDGAPGIYSARWAEPSKNFDVAMQRIQNELGEKKDRSAFFICVLALYWPDGYHEFIEGRIDGTIALHPKGTNGHGYDPLFIPKNDIRTFAEMRDEDKNAISHRGIATRLLLERFHS
jgi:XTP/dITP diphosphohydrolase